MGDWKIIPDDDCVDINDNGIVTFNKECNNLKDKYTVIYNNGMCESKTYIIVKKEDVCNKFIVDGGEWDNVPSTGDTACDSAFLWVDGTPIFEPSSASEWISINMYHWDEVPHTYDYFCTVYTDAPCVANGLMKAAGIVDNDISCSDVPTPTMADMPEVVREAITGNNEYTHALGTIRYTVAPNPTNKPRSCTIRWIVNSQECPSRDFTISQLGTLVCKCNDLKVSGNKTIDSSARSNFEIGTYTAGCVTNIAASEPADWITSISADNGSIKASINENTSTTNTRATEITVTGKAGSDICTKSFTLTQNPKSETCTCNDLIVSGKTISYEAKENIQIGSYSVNCITNISAASSLEWVTILSVNNGKIFAKVTENESTESARTANITVTGKAGSNTCTKTFTLIQNKKVTACTTCEDANIEGLSGGTTAEGGTNILIGSFSYDCNPGLTAKRVGGENFVTNITVNNGNVYGTVSPNTATTSRTEDIGIYVGDDTTPCAQYTLTQQGATPSTCTCEDAKVQIGTTAITLGYSAMSTAETTYRHDCTVYINNNEAEGWLDVNATDGKLEFNSTSQASSSRNANVYIDDANGNHCKTINVTQNGCGAKLNISYGIQFENQPVAVDSLIDGSVYSVGGAKVNYTKCDGSKGSFLISAAYGTTDTFVNFHKGDFIDGSEAKKTTSYTVSDLASIDSITLPQFISVGGGRNIWGTTETPWGGDFRNLSEKVPDTTYAYGCYASCISSDSSISARNTYTLNGNNLTIYLSFEEIIL